MCGTGSGQRWFLLSLTVNAHFQFSPPDYHNPPAMALGGVGFGFCLECSTQVMEMSVNGNVRWLVSDITWIDNVTFVPQ